MFKKEKKCTYKNKWLTKEEILNIKKSIGTQNIFLVEYVYMK